MSFAKLLRAVSKLSGTAGQAIAVAGVIVDGVKWFGSLLVSKPKESPPQPLPWSAVEKQRSDAAKSVAADKAGSSRYN